MSKEKGGPAFPTETDFHHFHGMTLRDYFAAKAMQSFMTAWIMQSEYPDSDLEVAEYAYSMADAMLKAREQ